MRFYFKDYDGNEVLTPTFTQYDSGQVIYVTDVAYDPAVYTGGPAFHFWNKNSEEVLFAGATPLDGGQFGDPSTVYQCALPNVLLGEGLPFFAAFYLANETPDKPACTVGIIRITMEQRPEPGFDLNYDNETKITAQTIFSLIGLFGEDDVQATAAMIRDATGGAASTYIGWLNKIVADAEASMGTLQERAVAAVGSTQATAVGAVVDAKDAAVALIAGEDGYLTQANRAKTEAQDAERDAKQHKADAAGILTEVQTERNNIQTAAQNYVTTNVLHGYQINVATTAPTNTSGQKVITFVVDA